MSAAPLLSWVSCDEVLDNRKETFNTLGENEHKSTAYDCNLGAPIFAPFTHFTVLLLLSVENHLLGSMVCSLPLQTASWEAPSVIMGIDIPWANLLLLLAETEHSTQTY